MSLRSRKELWLLVEWGAGVRGVVNSNDLISPSRDQVKVGSVVTLSTSDDEGCETVTATVIGKSHDRGILEHQLRPSPKVEEADADQLPNNAAEERDFSPSGSSWAPSNKSDTTSDDSEEETKKIKLDFPLQRRQYSENKNKKVMMPKFRATPVIPNIMKQEKVKANGDHRVHNGSSNRLSTISHNSSRGPMTPNHKQNLKRDILDIVEVFRELFNAIEELKPQSKLNEQFEYDITEDTPVVISNYNSEDERSVISDLSDRSDDNILITNKYDIVSSSRNNEITPRTNGENVPRRLSKPTDDYTANNTHYSQNGKITNHFESRIARLSSQHANKMESLSPKNQDMNGNNGKAPKILHIKSEKSINKAKQYSFDNDSAGAIENPVKPEDEWVPIGTGNTLIHKDKFRKVNWKSYTFATRTLLLAAFPRRILATHSLTGKQSPAFHNKPAKMCLDPKIVSDIIIEITDRFAVRDNLVRSIITTKCADECKMLKMRLAKKKNSKEEVNQENIPPQHHD